MSVPYQPYNALAAVVVRRQRVSARDSAARRVWGLDEEQRIMEQPRDSAPRVAARDAAH